MQKNPMEDIGMAYNVSWHTWMKLVIVNYSIVILVIGELNPNVGFC